MDRPTMPLRKRRRIVELSAVTGNVCKAVNRKATTHCGDVALLRRDVVSKRTRKGGSFAVRMTPPQRRPTLTAMLLGAPQKKRCNFSERHCDTKNARTPKFGGAGPRTLFFERFPGPRRRTNLLGDVRIFTNLTYSRLLSPTVSKEEYARLRIPSEMEFAQTTFAKEKQQLKRSIVTSKYAGVFPKRKKTAGSFTSDVAQSETQDVMCAEVDAGAAFFGLLLSPRCERPFDFELQQDRFFTAMCSVESAAANDDRGEKQCGRSESVANATSAADEALFEDAAREEAAAIEAAAAAAASSVAAEASTMAAESASKAAAAAASASEAAHAVRLAKSRWPPPRKSRLSDAARLDIARDDNTLLTEKLVVLKDAFVALGDQEHWLCCDEGA
jgi:hypothetical protein